MPQLNPDTSWWAGYSSLQRSEEQWPAYTRRTNSVTYCIQVSVLQTKGIYHPLHQIILFDFSFLYFPVDL